MGIGNIKDCYHQLSKDIVINSLTHEYRLIIPLLLILQDLLIQNSQVEFCPHMWFRKRLKLIIFISAIGGSSCSGDGLGWGRAALVCMSHEANHSTSLHLLLCHPLPVSSFFCNFFELETPSWGRYSFLCIPSVSSPSWDCKMLL